MFKSLLAEAEKNGVQVVEHVFNSRKLKGLYMDGFIILNSRAIRTWTEKTCIIAEELGHYHTSAGNILDQSTLQNRKQEKRARNWAYERLVSLLAITEAFEHGVQNRYELADYLNVTEEFLTETIDHYQEKYGLCTPAGDYIVYFNPLGVVKLFE
ncbi:ImmA/IrrE family metallo-endopeptidase [Paenibacillus sp. FJAT-26967]|uniref:ImmA/IrrE family metallo-endopeptidase n=1 Tax=Paenibacillus sp. FJAT-26967 TaxID=1729690 RepID=UPI0008398DDB|nr:ImmA/IrrE family metallo-endopeptidase [Paenibacillus sp. FJAT-26967]